MKGLSENEFTFLMRELERDGLTYAGLQNELLDHLCCCIEEEMEKGRDFADALRVVREDMGQNCIREIQEDTLLLINQKYRIMKKLMFSMGIIAPVLIVLASLLKVQHLPGSGVLLVAGWLLLAAVYLPLFIIIKVRDTRKEGKKVRWGQYLGGLLAGIIIITGTLFKTMHWPGAGFMLSLAGLAAVLVLIPILIINALKERENQVQNFTVLILVLSFLALTFMNYSLNISKSVLGSFKLPLDNNQKITEYLEQNKPDTKTQIDAPESLLIDSIQAITQQAEEFKTYLVETMQELASAVNPNNAGLINANGAIGFEKLHDKSAANTTASYMLGIDYPVARGKEIVLMMNSLRGNIERLEDDRLSEMAGVLLSTSGPVNGSEDSWIYYNFEHLPMVSVLLQLSALRVNTSLVENEVLRWAGEKN